MGGSGKNKPRKAGRPPAPGPEAQGQAVHAGGLALGLHSSLVYVPLALVMVLSGLLGYREIFSPDIGFYLEMGKLAAEEGRVLFHDEWTYSRLGAVVEHSPWLFGLMQWVLYKHGGTLAMVVAHTGLVLLVYTTLVLRSRAELGRISSFCAPWLLLFSLSSLWEIRPHTFSWLGLSLVCWAVESWQRGDRRWIWFIPCLMPLWVNIHSLFVLGLVVLAIFALAEILPRRPWSGQFLVAGLLAGLACFLTPYWQTIAAFPIKQFVILSSGLINSDTEGTREFLSPFRLDYYRLAGPFIWWQSILFVQFSGVMSLLALAAVWRKRRLWEGILFCAFGYLFFQAVKNHGYFIVATFPLVVSGLETIRDKAWAFIEKCRPSPPDWVRQAASLAGCLMVTSGVAVVGLQWANGYLYQQDRTQHRTGHQFNSFYLPVEACQFLRETLPANTHILNNWDAGGYLHWATGRPVFIDGRNEVMGEDFYREYLRFKNPGQLPVVLEKWNTQAALVPYNDIPLWFDYFFRAKNWRLVYSDNRYAIFYRRDCAPLVPEKSRPLAGVDYPDYRREDLARILRDSLSRHDPGLWEGLFSRHYEPRKELGWVAQFLLMGDNRAAASMALSGLEKSTFVAPDLLIYLGHALYGLKDREGAFDCYRTALRYLEDPTARERLRVTGEGPGEQ